MKAFLISEEQIARIVGGLIADELSWRFKRHTDSLTLASWSGETAFGPEGISLSPDERTACARQCARFFGVPGGDLEPAGAETIAAWAARIGEALRREMRRFSFTPAGRDSETESCLHAADEVFHDAAAAANLLYGRRRLISLVAPHSLLGFAVTVLTPNLQHIPSLDARGMTPDRLAESLTFGDVVIATPTLWRYMINEGVRAPDNAMAVSFGEIMPTELAADIRKAGFGAFRELYGSTETGLIGWRDSPSDAFLLFDQWRREGDTLLRVTPDGETRAVEPMDALDWTTARSFRLAGRRDGAVQIGAVNVFPERIASVLCDHPSIEDCRIHAAHYDGGINRLVARIKLKPAVAPNEHTARLIDAWCRTHLRQQERPRIYNFEADLGADSGT